jgi:DNA processing protein
VISGLARGIDALAHRTALENGGLTVAVVAHGVDLVYPPEHAALMEQIVAQGLVVSEHPPGIAALRQHFPARNRILSGLADAVAIMEASRQSGTMITADFAADQNRDVYAVPGSILSKNSQGCNQLIQEGAYFLETADDILNNPPWRLKLARQALPETFIPETLVPDNSQLSLPDVASPMQVLPDHQDRCWLALFSGQPLSLEEAARQMERTMIQTSAWLSIQEVNGWIRNDRGRYALTESGYSCI